MLDALLPVLGLLGLLLANSAISRFAPAYEGTVHLPLLGGSLIAALVALRLGWRWADLEQGMIEGIQISLKAILILLVIGLLIGTWIAAGIVPLLISYGLHLLSPTWFLAAACLICAVVSLATGSSWTTAGTVGIALMGVAQGLGLNPAMVAGAIISGAYFGDKISPLSDTTNLAPAVAGVDLFDHIRHLLWTTVPSLGIALLLYVILGFTQTPAETSHVAYDQLVIGLEDAFNLNPILLLAPALVIVMVVRRLPALPALLIGALLGGLGSIFIQDLPRGFTLAEATGRALTAAYSGYAPATGVAAVDDLLASGGLVNMLETIAIVLLAMAFGGLMERAGLLQRLASAILALARGTGSLVAATLSTCIGMNLVASDQYLAIVVPGRMFKTAFARARLHPKNLSRCLEDAGTLTSPLIAWNSCGAFMADKLGLGPSAYLWFAFFNLLNPLISLLYGFTGWTMERAEEEVNHRGTEDTEGAQRTASRVPL